MSLLLSSVRRRWTLRPHRLDPQLAALAESRHRIWSEALASWPELHSVRSWVDIGAHTWREITTVAQLFPMLEHLLGVELLARRRVSFFQTVESLARTNAAPLIERGVVIDYWAGDFAASAVAERVAAVRADLLSFSYPFVSRTTALAWGVRRKQYREFDALLQSALVAHPRHILSIHQGEWEAEEATQAYLRVFGAGAWSRARKLTVPTAPVHDAVLWFLPLA